MDPEHDTPGVLKAYAESYGVDDPQYRFATGSLQASRDLKKQLWIQFRSDPNLILQHSMRTLLIGPDLKIIYQVPGSKWEMEDILEKIRLSVQDFASTLSKAPSDQ
jgi:protein SCO1/2